MEYLSLSHELELVRLELLLAVLEFFELLVELLLVLPQAFASLVLELWLGEAEKEILKCYQKINVG